MNENYIPLPGSTEPIPESEFENFTYEPTVYLDLLLTIHFNRLKVDGTNICHVPEMTVYEPYGDNPKYTFPNPKSRFGWFAIEAKHCPNDALAFIKERLKTPRRFTLINYFSWSTFRRDASETYLKWLMDTEHIGLELLDINQSAMHTSTFLVDNQEHRITWFDLLHQGELRLWMFEKMDLLFRKLYPKYKYKICQIGTDMMMVDLAGVRDFCVPYAFFMAKEAMMKEYTSPTTKRKKDSYFSDRAKKEVFDIVKDYGTRWAILLSDVDEVDDILSEVLMQELGNPPFARLRLTAADEYIPWANWKTRHSEDRFPIYTYGGRSYAFDDFTYYDELV